MPLRATGVCVSVAASIALAAAAGVDADARLDPAARAADACQAQPRGDVVRRATVQRPAEVIKPPVPDPPPVLPPIQPAPSFARAALLAPPAPAGGLWPGGRQRIPVARQQDRGLDVALQPDGKLVVAGQAFVGGNANAAVVRYLRDGRLDPSFGNEGAVLTDVGGEDAAEAVVVQPDGKIVVAGTTASNLARAFVARYGPTGEPDRSFGDGGRIVINLARASNRSSRASDVVLQRDGLIVVGGSAQGVARSPDADFAVARFTRSGALDLSFGRRGVATVDFGGSEDFARGLALHEDRRSRTEKIVAVGYTVDVESLAINGAVARLKPSGARDAFGTGGRVETTFQGGVGFRMWEAVAVRPDGKIVVGGLASLAFCLNWFSAARYTASGQLDTSFGTGGTVESTPSGAAFDLANDLALLPDGRVLLGGLALDPTNIDWDPALVRLNTAGRLDTRGDAFTPASLVLRLSGADEDADALAVQPDGRIVLVGRMLSDTALARVRFSRDLRRSASGLDTTFGVSGVVRTNVGHNEDVASAVALQPDGKLVVAGTMTSWAQTYGTFIRLLPDGRLDPAFANGGFVVLATAGAVAVAPDGDVLVAGGYLNHPGSMVARYSPSGTYKQARTAFFGIPAAAHDLLVHPDGRFVAVGSRTLSGNADLALVRWLGGTTSLADPAFGVNGRVTTAVGTGNEEALAAVLQPDGRMLVAGWTDRDGTEDFLLARYLDNGTLDASFGAGGIVVTPFGAGAERATSIALRPDGRIILGGWTRGVAGQDAAFARYLPNGALDGSFGSGGKLVSSLAAGDDGVADLHVRPNGVVLAAATAGSGSGADFALVRVSPDGTAVEPTRTDFGGGEDVARALVPLSDGTFVVAGSSFSAHSLRDFALAHYAAP